MALAFVSIDVSSVAISPIGVGGLGLRIAGRRHQVAAQLAYGGFEDFRVLRDGLRRHALEGHVARQVILVVAIGAVGSKQPPACLLAGVLDSIDGNGRRHRDAGDDRSSEPSP